MTESIVGWPIEPDDPDAAIAAGRMLARFLIAEACPAGLILWGRWEWVEPDFSGQMWPLSRERRSVRPAP